MQGEISEIFTTLVGLFAIIGVGYFTVKLKVISPDASGHFITILMKITLPCTVFLSIQGTYDPNFLKDSLIIASIGTALCILSVLSCKLAARALHIRAGNHGTWTMSIAFMNSGFMGYPIVLAIFGEEGLALAAVMNLPLIFLMYTLGINLVCSDSQKGEKNQTNLVGMIFSPINISMAVGLAVYALQLEVPQMVLSPITYLGNITTPMSMFIVGTSLAATDIKSVFTDKAVYYASFIRLVIIPLAVWLGLGLLPLENELIIGVSVIMFSMPTAAVASAIAGQYGGDQDLAAKITFITSLFSLFTIPIWAMLA